MRLCIWGCVIVCFLLIATLPFLVGLFSRRPQIWQICAKLIFPPSSPPPPPSRKTTSETKNLQEMMRKSQADENNGKINRLGFYPSQGHPCVTTAQKEISIQRKMRIQEQHLALVIDQWSRLPCVAASFN